MNPKYKINPTDRKTVNHLVAKHYLHRWPGVVVATLALFEESTPIGVLVFALPPRETCKRYKVNHCWELARLFIEDCTPKNTETWFVARAIYWIRQTHPEVQCLVSYADPSAKHKGTIYLAGNWITDGRTDQERKTPRFDYVFAGKRYSRRAHVPEGVVPERTPRVSKFRFVYWLDGLHEKRRAASLVTLLPLPLTPLPTPLHPPTH